MWLQELREKKKQNAYYIYMDRNFFHFFIVYKKNLNFRPIFLGKMDILTKREVLWKVGQEILLQLR
jgi:hypothetical protein